MVAFDLEVIGVVETDQQLNLVQLVLERTHRRHNSGGNTVTFSTMASSVQPPAAVSRTTVGENDDNRSVQLARDIGTPSLAPMSDTAAKLNELRREL